MARKKAEKVKTDMDKKTSKILKLEIQVKETTMIEVKALKISQENDTIGKSTKTKMDQEKTIFSSLSA
jgi:hypothetical protein